MKKTRKRPSYLSVTGSEKSIKAFSMFFGWEKDFIIDKFQLIFL